MIRKLKNLFHLLGAFLANLIYNFPSTDLTLIGVTGTDGKTTTVHLIYEILKEAGLKVEMISTVSAPGLHTTTPNSFILGRLLRKMVSKKIKYVVLEASSHGLDQYRLWGIRFQIAVFTNVTHDHLDYHKTYQHYLKSKAKLLQNVKIAILNRDDLSYNYLLSRVKSQRSKLITYGIINQADFTPKVFKFETNLPGVYNQYNCLAAIACSYSLGIPEEVIRKAITSFKGVIGRMEEVNQGQNFRVIVDFASTPNALEQVLKTLRLQIVSTGRVIAVFGSAGLRDIQKRPKMGEVAVRLADISVLTAEDPRTEDNNQIINQIVQGCLKGGGIEGKNFFRIPDRREAIKFAINLAKKGDIVILCGKGHERSICYGRKEYPWNEQDEAKKLIKERLRSD